MKAFLPALTISGLLGLASIAAHASDGSVTVNGTVATNTCSINGVAAGTSFDKTVTLPTVTTSSFSSGRQAGASAPTDLQLVLTNCAGPATKVVASFINDPTLVSSAAGALLNLATTGAAQNVQILLYNASWAPIDATYNSNNDVATNGAMITNGNATLQYYAKYTNIGVVQPGTVLSKVTYQLVYQ